MRISPNDTAAIVVDMQEKLMAAMWNKEACEERAITLIKGLKALDIPVIISQQYTKGLGNSVSSVYEAAGTTEYYDKAAFSCMKDQGIREAIEVLGKHNVIIMGTEGHVCVLQTCIDLKEMGYQPILAVDSIASRKESDMNIGIQRAIQEGVIITSAEAILFELTVDSKNPAFKAISKIVK